MKRVAFAAAALALVAGLATGCGGKGSGEAGGGSTASGEVGVVLPFLTSPFWQAYNHYVPQQAAAQGVDALPTVNSDSSEAWTHVRPVVGAGDDGRPRGHGGPALTDAAAVITRPPEP
ncbi:hypothetical protein ACFY3M_25740 [Streptomyces mirabilis]|uniref:hypothetical protein n=1 Tax=Streptomyces mirabilis TaxID=68239 RepID=UPI00369B86E6